MTIIDTTAQTIINHIEDLYIDRPTSKTFTAGTSCYNNGVSSYRITGADSAFMPDKPKDVPQSLIRHYRSVTKFGIGFAFPHDMLIRYLEEQVLSHNFSVNAEAEGQKIDLLGFYLDDYPRILSEINPPPTSNSFLQSAENDIRKDFSVTSDIYTYRQDRKQLQNIDLYRFYKYSIANPKLIAAFLLFQYHMIGYCKQLLASLDAILADEDEERKPLIHLLKTSSTSFVLTNISLYMGVYCLGVDRHDMDMSDDRLINGIDSARQFGVYRRTFQTEFGERTVVCPFSNFVTEILTAQSVDNQSVINFYYQTIIQKIKEGNEDVSSLCDKIVQSLRSTLDNSTAHELNNYARLLKI